MKRMRLKMKNRSHRCDINRPRPRHGHKYNKYKMCHGKMFICVLSNTQVTFEAQFMNRVSNLKKSIAYKKRRVRHNNRNYLGISVSCFSLIQMSFFLANV